MGNHDVKCLSPEYASVPLPNLVFAHYPVRSKNQIATKAVRDGPGKASVDLRCMHGTGWHILEIYRNLRKQNFQLHDDDMIGLSLFYGGFPTASLHEKKIRKIALKSDPVTLYPAIHCMYPPTPFDLYDTILSTFVTLNARYKMENPVFCMKTLLAANDTISRDYRQKLCMAMASEERRRFKRRVLFFRMRVVTNPAMKILGKILPPACKNKLKKLLS